MTGGLALSGSQIVGMTLSCSRFLNFANPTISEPGADEERGDARTYLFPWPFKFFRDVNTLSLRDCKGGGEGGLVLQYTQGGSTIRRIFH